MFEGLNIVDLRPYLPRPKAVAGATGAPQGRRSSTGYAVLHYNGAQPVSVSRMASQAGVVAWLKDVIIPNHITRIGADGVQYHAWVGSDGTLYQLRDWDALLWHCGNYSINSTSVALHIPIGGNMQQPTAAQWTSATRFFDAASAGYHVGRERVKGHLECGKSACPGPILMAKLRAWRSGSSYRTKTVATVRSIPNRLTGLIYDTLPKGRPIDAVEVQGQAYGGSAVWYEIHLANGKTGYIHSSAVERS